MGGFIGAVIGAILTTFGFLVMRNPMRLAVLREHADITSECRWVLPLGTN
jgi:hypothetical protein